MINRVVTISPSAKETQVFLGLVGFWRLHIPGHSQFLTQKKRYFEWALEQQEAFGHLKEETAHMVALEPVQTGKSVQNVLCTVAREHILTRSLWQKKPIKRKPRSAIRVLELRELGFRSPLHP